MRTQAVLRTLAVVALASTPTACSEWRQVRLSGDLHRPAVSVAKAGSERAMSACVDSIAIFDTGRLPGIAGAVWRVRSATDDCVDLDTVVYGETPDGFVVDTPPEALREGVTYEAGAHGWTSGWLPSVPWYGGGRFVFSEGAWRVLPR